MNFIITDESVETMDGSRKTFYGIRCQDGQEITDFNSLLENKEDIDLLVYKMNRDNTTLSEALLLIEELLEDKTCRYL